MRSLFLVFWWVMSGIISAAQYPITYYPFNGNANDSSTSSNNAIVYGATLSSDRFGNDGKAYAFDGGSQRMQAPKIPDYDFGAGDFSITSFIKVRNIASSRIVSAGYRENDKIWGLGFGTNSVWGSGIRINYFVYSNNGYRDFNSNEISNYSIGQWAFVGVSKSAGTLRFYFNGKLVGESAIGYQSNANSFLSIGCRQDNPNQFIEFFNGKIDEIRIYNSAISSLEMERLAKDGLVAHYKMDGNGRDTSGNGYHGTLQFVQDTTNRFDQANESLSFNGSSAYINVPHTAALQINGTVSLVAWAKRTRLGIDMILEKGGDWTSGTCNYGMSLHSISNNMFYFFFNGGWRGTTGVQDYGWHHYAVVAKEGDTNPKLYIDGVQRPVEFSQGISTLSFGSSTADLHIGAQLGTANYFGANILDEVYIFNRSLDSLEIGHFAGNGILAMYYFNGNASDSSGFGHHATNSGAAITTDRRLSADSAYSLNGSNNKMTAPEHPNWNLGFEDFSVVAWVNLQSLTTARIVSAGYDGNEGIWALGFGTNPIWGTGLRINWYVRSGNINRDFDSKEITNYTLGTWAFVGVTKKGTTLTFLLNRDTVGTATVTYAANANSYLVIGARQYSGPDNIIEWWPGKLDELRIYNRVISAAELEQLTATQYHFIGSGNWSDAANWEGFVKPPFTIPSGHVVFIDPTGTSECIINDSLEVSSGAQLLLRPGKRMRFTK